MINEKVDKEWYGNDNPYPFPFVGCDYHPGPQLGYVICRHLLYRPAPPFQITPATDEDLGEILCQKHCELLLAGEPATVNEFAVICAGCAAKEGFLTEAKPVAN